jgi:ribonuclease P/MRP protein subunit POP5
LALQAEGEVGFGEREVIDTLWRAVYQLFGEVGASQIDLRQSRQVQIGGGILVVRCSHKALSSVRAAVASITEVEGQRAAIRVIAVSGTLKGLRRKLTSRGVVAEVR